MDKHDRWNLDAIHEFYENHKSLLKRFSLDNEHVEDVVLNQPCDDIFDEYIDACHMFFKHNPMEGIQMLQTSVEHGNDFAALVLAEEYRLGEIIPADKEQALSWLEKYAEMDTCLYVMDRMYPIVDIEKYHSRWYGATGTIYDVTPHSILDTDIQKSFGWSDMGVQDLGLDNVGTQLFGRFFDMIKFTHHFEDKVTFRFDSGKVTTDGLTFEYSDLDLVSNIKEILKGLDEACDEMIPVLEERDYHIRIIAEMKERFNETYIDEEDLTTL